MPVTSADLLSAAIAPQLTFAPAGQSAPTATGSPATISFENLLASAQASPTTPPTLSIPTALAVPAVESTQAADAGLSTIGNENLTDNLDDSLPELSPSDLAGTLAFFFSVANTVPSTVVAPAAVAVSDAVPAVVAAVPDVAATTAEIAVETPEPVPPEIGETGETRTRSDAIRLAQSPSISKAPSPTVTREPSSVPTTASEANAKPTEEPAESPAVRAEPSRIDATLAIPNTVATTAATPADAGRAASRTPSVVAQSPIIVDRPPVLPGETPIVLERPVQPPTVPVQGVSPISPNEQPPLNLRPSTVLAQEAVAANVKPKVAGSEFATELRRVDAVVPSVPPSTAIPDAVEVSSAPTVRTTEIATAVVSGAPAIRPTVIPTGEVTVAAPPIAVPPSSTRPVLPNSDDVQLADRSRTDADVSIPGYAPPAGDVRPTVPFAAPAVPAAPPTPAAQLGDAIIEHAAIAERDGKFEIQIRLDPPELGPVKVKLVAHGDRLSAEVVVSNDAIRSMIESQLPDLRQRLEQTGLSLPNLDVSTGGSGNRNSETEDWQQRSFGSRSAAPAPRRMPTARSAAGSGTVDVVV